MQASDLESLERVLFDSIDSFTVEQHLKEAMRHCVFPPGKRIRPHFAISLCRDLGGDPVLYYPDFSSLELLHTSSLIHDDLPCLDNDDIRRGRPTCHKQFGEATALLTGDALVALSFKLIAQSQASAEQKVLLLNSLSGAYLSLCNGQQLDILPEMERGEIKNIHFQKTGALFGTSFEFGAISAGADHKTQRAAYIYGEWFGFAFQVLDDFLDIYGDPEQRGRPPGSDERNEKKTFFSGRNFRDASLEIEEILGTLQLHAEQLKKYCGSRGLQHTQRLMDSILEPLRAQR